MSQLYSFRITVEQIEQRFQPIFSFRSLPEAGWKLEQDAAEFARFNEWMYSFFELFNRCRSPVALLVGELLPGFEGKFEIRGSALRPAFGGLGSARTIKRGIDFDGVEVSRIE